MKKFAAVGLALACVLLGFAACNKSAGNGSENALSLIPTDTQGVVVIDIHKAMTTAIADKAIKESQEFQKYQEFIKETGIDPQKDIDFAAIGISGIGKSGESSGAGVGVISLKYNKDTLLAKFKAKATDVKEANYEGVTLYTAREGNGQKPVWGAFLDDSRIVLGTETSVKAVIDVFAKKADNIYKNAGMAALFKTANKKAMIWCAFDFPPDMMKNVASSTPMMSDVAGVKALLAYFDYANKSLQLEIKAIGGDADKNKKLADALIGFKALGGMASGDKPEVGELLNKIEISSAPDSVKIFANVPEDLLNKLSATAQKTVEEKIAGAKSEEKKDEKKEEKKEVKK
ncbi:MAG: DUF3352 domain-containing protein [Candidatus Aminicenantales bacterium]